ncbi:coiled-coil domain-containing protein 117-like [Anolis carolinensis]|uniref:coiled-coil domain-containing protein 117-like n=1 Tax=Anolis carolinensis TaxID=28377 RepID=UPI002F2B33DA
MMATRVEAGPAFAAGLGSAPRRERARACRRGRKHKMGGKEPEGVPLPKKRMTEEEAGPFLIGGPSPLPALPPADPPTSCESVEMEEMATVRRLREIEERIIDDEDDEDDNSNARQDGGHVGLPRLVMSEALKDGLRQRTDFGHEGGGLTKRILESMSRPSMELVLWKPLPSAILKKASSSASSSLPLLFGNADPAAEEEMEL